LVVALLILGGCSLLSPESQAVRKGADRFMALMRSGDTSAAVAALDPVARPLPLEDTEKLRTAVENCSSGRYLAFETREPVFMGDYGETAMVPIVARGLESFADEVGFIVMSRGENGRWAAVPYPGSLLSGAWEQPQERSVFHLLPAPLAARSGGLALSRPVRVPPGKPATIALPSGTRFVAVQSTASVTAAFPGPGGRMVETTPSVLPGQVAYYDLIDHPGALRITVSALPSAAISIVALSWDQWLSLAQRSSR
jgi:hypothetical protein